MGLSNPGHLAYCLLTHSLRKSRISIKIADVSTGQTPPTSLLHEKALGLDQELQLYPWEA